MKLTIFFGHGELFLITGYRRSQYEDRLETGAIGTLFHGDLRATTVVSRGLIVSVIQSTEAARRFNVASVVESVKSEMDEYTTLEELCSLLGLHQNTTLVRKRSFKAVTGRLKERFQQLYHGLEVVGGGFSAVYTPTRGYTGTVSGEVFTSLEKDIADPDLCKQTEEAVQEVAFNEENITASQATNIHVKRNIYVLEDTAYLTYEVSFFYMNGHNPRRPSYFIDACNLTVAYIVNNIKHSVLVNRQVHLDSRVKRQFPEKYLIPETSPETTTQQTTPEAVTLETTPEATTQENTPEATTQENTPEATKQEITPDTTTQENTPEATTQEITPEVTSQVNTREVTSQQNTPEATTQENTPDATTQEITQEVTSQETTPEVTTQENTPEATKQVNTAKATTQKITPEATTQENTPETITQENTPEATTQESTSEATTQENTPEAITQEITPEVTTQENTPEVTTQENTLETTTHENTPKAAIQENAPVATTRKNKTEATTQENTPEATTHRNTPEVTTQENTPVATTQENKPEATTQGNCPKATTQETTAEATTHENTPEATTQEITPESTTQENTPEATTQQNTPEANTQETTPEATSQETSQQMPFTTKSIRNNNGRGHSFGDDECPVVTKTTSAPVTCSNPARGQGGNKKVGRVRYGVHPLCLNTTVKGTKCILENQYVRVIDLKQSTRRYNSRTASYTCSQGYNDAINGAYSPVLDAMHFGTACARMFIEWYGMMALSFKPRIFVHYDHRYENAFWDGRSLTFGDGHNFLYPLVSQDVVAHELAHGFTDSNSDLIYNGQSGGINEAFSDITGEATEMFATGSNDWSVGAEIFKRKNLALRYFDDPTKDRRALKHVRDYNNDVDVHYSSGIFNHAFYQMVEVNKMPMKQAYECFLIANTNYWRRTTTFEEGARDVVRACYDLGYNHRAAKRSFKVVGITFANFPDRSFMETLSASETLQGVTVSLSRTPVFVLDIPQGSTQFTANCTGSSGPISMSLYDDLDSDSPIVTEVGEMVCPLNSTLNYSFYLRLFVDTDTDMTDVTMRLTYE